MKEADTLLMNKKSNTLKGHQRRGKYWKTKYGKIQKRKCKIKKITEEWKKVIYKEIWRATDKEKEKKGIRKSKKMKGTGFKIEWYKNIISFSSTVLILSDAIAQ